MVRRVAPRRIIRYRSATAMTAVADHVALSVRDLDASIAFYRDLLGFEVRRVIEVPPEMNLGRIAGLPACTARIAHLFQGPLMLELFHYLEPEGRPAGDRTQADRGFSHLGFRCRDIRADIERLRQAGVDMAGELVEFRPEVWVQYFYGPDREVLELRQLPAAG